MLNLNITFIGKRPGPAVVSPFHFIKFSFKDGIDSVFYKALNDAVAAKAWQIETPNNSNLTSPTSVTPKTSTSPINSKIRSGIVGIERSIEEQHKATDQSISIAFQDLTKLMEKAKEMVTISKTISSKIRVIMIKNINVKHIKSILPLVRILFCRRSKVIYQRTTQ